MADESLYPVFSIPTIVASDIEDDNVYKLSPEFDFRLGDFKRDGTNRVLMVDGKESYRQWVLKALNTQQGACLSYLGIGVDADSAMAETSRPAVQAAFERSITEALLANPKTKRVRDFSYEWNTDALHISFTVQGANLPAFDVNMSVIS